MLKRKKTDGGARIFAFSPSTRSRSEVRNKEHFVGNNKNPDQKQPGEKEPGTFHYNPGNMSGRGPAPKDTPQNPQPSIDKPTDKIGN